MMSLRAAASLLALALAIAGADPVGAQDQDAVDGIDDEAEPTIPTVNQLVGLGELSPGVERVIITGNGYEAAAADYLNTLSLLGTTGERIEQARTERTSRVRDRGRLRMREVRLEAERRAVAIERAHLDAAVRELAIATFVAAGTDADATVAPFDHANIADGFTRAGLHEEAEESLLERLEARDVELVDLRDEIDETAVDIDSNAGAIAELDALVTSLRIEHLTLGQTLNEKAQSVRDTRMLARVRGADFPVVALDAYVAAAARAQEDTGCQIQWWMLAGVGKTESGHGIAQGAQLEADGSTSVKIIGIPLDGTNGTAHIADTDGGELDGDPVVDRAVGPMQFIPEAWKNLGIDGNDDGEIDPHNLYDAAASAARYLCRGRSMATEEELRAAYFSYNRHQEYVELVLQRAYGYQQLNLGI